MLRTKEEAKGLRGLLRLWTVRNEDGSWYRDSHGKVVVLQSPLRDKRITAEVMKRAQVQGEGLPETIEVRPMERIEVLKDEHADYYFQGREQFLEVVETA